MPFVREYLMNHNVQYLHHNKLIKQIINCVRTDMFIEHTSEYFTYCRSNMWRYGMSCAKFLTRSGGLTFVMNYDGHGLMP